MPDRPIEEPWVIPQRLEAGVSGIPKAREWDLVRLVELPDLGSDPTVVEFEFSLLEGGEVRILGLDGALVEPAARRIEAATSRVPRPAEGRARRTGTQRWSVAARHVPGTTLELDVPVEIEELSVALPPDGGRIRLVDGDESLDPLPSVERGFEQLEAAGLQRSAAQCFVALARRLDERRFAVRIDPL